MSLLQRLCEVAEGQAAEAAAAEAAATATLVSLGGRGPCQAPGAAAAAAAAAGEHARSVDVEPAEAMEVEGAAMEVEGSGAAGTPMIAADAAMGSDAPCEQPRLACSPPTPLTPAPLEEHFFSALTKLLDAHALHCVQRRPAA